jgi:hypothetical protein
MATTNTLKRIEDYLSDAQNFGDWLEKINDVIDAYNNSIDIITETSTDISSAKNCGQIGETLTTPAKTSYNDYIKNGVYYVPMTAKNRPENKNVDTNLYVATNGTSITQLAVTIETEAKLYIRKGSYDGTTATFEGWYNIPSRDYNDGRYLMVTGGDTQVKGGLTIGSTTFKNV